MGGASFAQQSAPEESECFLVAENEPAPIVLVDVSVLERTRSHDRFWVNYPDDMRVSALLCARSDVVPAADDYKVILAGYSLMLTFADQDSRDVTTVLDAVDDQFRLRVVEGELTEEERARARIRLESYYAALNGAAS